MSRLLRLYPAAWRQRYLVEVSDLLADRPPGFRSQIDLARGALDAWLHPQVVATATPDEREEPLMGSLTASGLAVVGGAMWIAAGLVINAAPMNPSDGYKDATAGLIVLVAGAILTALAAIRFATSSSAGSRVIQVTAVAMLVLAVVIIAPWPLMIVGFFGYAVATVVFGLLLASTLNQSLGGALALAALILPATNMQDARALMTIPLGLAWIAVGALVLRRVPAPARA
ncbi:MAG TPA: hypothetical protein VIM39_02665 [Candidatus Limnocylindrales bacterium]|jgi:hypothetical protein